MVRFSTSLQKGSQMIAFTFILAVVALIISILAYQRTGGLQSFQTQLEVQLEAVRRRTADTLDRIEKSLRGEGGSSAPPAAPTGPLP